MSVKVRARRGPDPGRLVPEVGRKRKKRQALEFENSSIFVELSSCASFADDEDIEDETDASGLRSTRFNTLNCYAMPEKIELSRKNYNGRCEESADS